MNNKYIILILFFIFLIFLYQFNNKPLLENETFSLSKLKSEKEIVSDIKESGIEKNNVEEFESELYNFSLLYPKNLSVKEYNEGGGASTITFQDIDSGLGFQIFIVPYYEDKITDERFYKDVPSGVRNNLKSFQFGGTQANSFDSFNDFLGETFEIWFIKDNFLYEVSTIKDLEPWFLEIMTTWQFLN